MLRTLRGRLPGQFGVLSLARHCYSHDGWLRVCGNSPRYDSASTRAATTWEPAHRVPTLSLARRVICAAKAAFSASPSRCQRNKFSGHAGFRFQFKKNEYFAEIPRWNKLPN